MQTTDREKDALALSGGMILFGILMLASILLAEPIANLIFEALK